MNTLSFKKIIFKTGTAVMLFVSLFLSAPVFAQTSNSGPDLGLAYPAESGLTNTDVRITTARILRIAMGLLGIIFVAIVIWGGWEWMTAGGNDNQIETAKKRIATGVIGLAIILSSYAIAYFVITNLTSATTAGSSRIY